MKKFLNTAKGHLMTGISYALPMIIGASLVVAIPKMIALAMGITSLDPFAETAGIEHYLYQIEQVGWTGIGLINTVLAGFIAYSIADKPALGAGLIGGAIASKTNAGFLGAMIAGFVAGYVVAWCKNNVRVSEKYTGMLPLIVFPLFATMSVALVMGVILAGPLGAINTGLVEWIKNMIENDVNKVVLALIMGAMIGSDLGGPINKASWLAGNVLLAEGIYLPAIIVNVAICAVPMGYALASLFHKTKMSSELLDASRNNYVMGFIGITEGAIPFTMVSPLKLVPINMIGGAIASAIGIVLGMYDKMPPVGGVYGFFTVGNGWAYLVGLFAGATFIGFVAPILVNFKETASTEDISTDDIEISFE
ncbi:PTS fructose transporter subunit IIC [Streptococcus sp. zg-86]|uniref:PTS fructose transporter subunit IIC n=1 Tax=Streptococcus zhangguiae TaxID=2664091 RepID=A0A6I4RH56_9STRE|nr:MULTISPECIES: PTS fructose transporter subunit IIC [unclassified Streptococcus]MTB64753.1 PTS fructose transporter subunit IIC [Streptococcus sp. zg-86]MTB91325.1 PTS fructose transporter subunit IIC [Streptococcus sp. zg-36]MWV56744.1 PTS fructose transporter subunit IIC [Streptococcus sp. zg-70]QTH48476.1 PTS fructose transporter subunit IIC [Streptococcus sp. zg-86]